ncbi:MAG: S41 family peptidase [Pseudomonadota bacterium]
MTVDFATGQVNADLAFYAHFPTTPDQTACSAWLGTMESWLDELDQHVVRHQTDAKQRLSQKWHPGLDGLDMFRQVSPAFFDRLMRIFGSRSGQQHYVNRSEWGGNADFAADGLAMDNPLWPVLAAARYWTAIRYFYPYQSLLVHWDNTLATALSQALSSAPQEERYRSALLTLIRATQDGHAGLFTDKGTAALSSGSRSLPLATRYVDGKLTVVGSASSQAQPGDTVVAVDGQSVDDLRAAFQPVSGTGRRETEDLLFARALTRGDSGGAGLTLRRQNDLVTCQLPFEDKMNRWAFPVRRGAAVQRLGSVAYLQFVFGAAKEVTEFCKTGWQDCRGIIVDLRGYPRFGFEALTRRFAEPGQPFAGGLFPELHTPGRFRRTAPLQIKPKHAAITKPTIVLIDEHSVSHAEYFALALGVSSRVTLLGTPTAGANGNRSFVPMPNGELACFSGYGIFHVDGGQTQGIGIAPDVICKPRHEDIAAGRDSLILKALSILGEPSDDL